MPPMPSTTIVQYAQTDSFTIEYDSSFSDAERRAAALETTLERDLSTFRDWFGIHDSFGPSDRCSVLVGQPQAGEACNFGYVAGGGSQIQVNPAQGWASDPALQLLLDDCVRGMWAMEFAEVMMSLDNQQQGHMSWNPRGSNGEGLSLVCGELLYPAAMYGINTQGYPRAGGWFAATPTRPNWLTTTESTDGNPLSWGCSIAFIFYLVSQIGRPLAQVIQARGATLEETYNNLTGMSDGFGAMTAVLEPYFPTGGTSQPGTDDPFPLYPDETARRVALSVVEQELSRTALAAEQVLRPLPFPCHGEVEASFIPEDVTLKLTAQATTMGFGNPQFAWTVGGIAVTVAGPFDVSAQVLPNDPLHPHPLRTPTRTVSLTSAAPTVTMPGPLEQAGVGKLELTLPLVGGSLELPISCAVSDAAATAPGTTTATIERGYQTRVIAWSDDWQTVSRDCREKAGKLSGHLFKPIIGQIMPDPPPDFIRAMEQLRQLLAELQIARKKGEKAQVETLTGVMRDYLNVPAAVIGVPPQPAPAPVKK